MIHQRTLSIWLLMLITNNLILVTFGYIHDRDANCLNGWGTVLGLNPKLVNDGLNMLNSELPPINGKIKIQFNDLPMPVMARFNNLRIRNFTLTPYHSDIHAANLNVKFSRGKIMLSINGQDISYNMAGINADIEVALQSYRHVLKNGGIKYYLGMQMSGKHAVWSLSLNISIMAKHLLSQALEIKIKELLASGYIWYKLLSFTIPYLGDDNRRFVPSTIDNMFNFDQTGHGNHVFAALMAMPNTTSPRDPPSYIFRDQQLLLPGSHVTFQIENHFLLIFILDELKKDERFRHLQLIVTNGCPGEITLIRPARNFSHGSDLVAFRITLEYNKMQLYLKATKKNISPGVNAHVEYGGAMSLSYNKSIRTQVAYEWDKKYTSDNSLSMSIYLFMCRLALDVNRLLVIPLVKVHIPGVLKDANNVISNFQNEMHFKVGGIALNATISQLKIDENGNLQVGAVNRNML